MNYGSHPLNPYYYYIVYEEHFHDGRDGLDVPGCHHGMAVKITVDLPIPLRKVACKSGDL